MQRVHSSLDAYQSFNNLEFYAMDSNNFLAGKSAVSNSIMSFLSTSSTSSTNINDKTNQGNKQMSKSSPSSGNEPFDIPKDELMALCMKLNKKMQSLESKCHDLNRVKISLNDDRLFLIQTISSILEENISVNADESTPRPMIQNIVDKWKSSQHENISSLEKKIIELETKRSDNTNINTNRDVNAFEISSSTDTQLEEITLENEVRIYVEE